MSIASTKFTEKFGIIQRFSVSRNGELVTNPINLLIEVAPFSSTGVLKLNGHVVKEGSKSTLLAEADRIEGLSDAEFNTEFKNLGNNNV